MINRSRLLFLVLLVSVLGLLVMLLMHVCVVSHVVCVVSYVASACLYCLLFLILIQCCYLFFQCRVQKNKNNAVDSGFVCVTVVVLMCCVVVVVNGLGDINATPTRRWRGGMVT